MIEVQWTEFSQGDLFEIADYLIAKDPAAAQRLCALVQERVSKLQCFPNLGREGRVKGTRQLVLNPNYIIVYQYDGVIITLLRVLHTARQWPAN